MIAHLQVHQYCTTLFTLICSSGWRTTSQLRSDVLPIGSVSFNFFSWKETYVLCSHPLSSKTRVWWSHVFFLMIAELNWGSRIRLKGWQWADAGVIFLFETPMRRNNAATREVDIAFRGYSFAIIAATGSDVDAVRPVKSLRISVTTVLDRSHFPYTILLTLQQFY